jgi:hypothetical protein
MHRQLLTCLFALSATVLASAQAPTTATPQPATGQTSPAATPDRAVTYTGCLQRGLAATSPAPNSVGTSASGTFVLANAVRSAGAAPGVGGGRTDPVGTAGGSPTAGVSYRLDGDTATLSPHVGHKVEIVGMLDEHTASPANRDTTSGDIGRTSGNPATLKVERVKMIASECVTP